MAYTARNKVMSAREAVERFVTDGCSIGLGGQNVARVATVIVHEIIRQGKRGFTLYGCNLSLSMDLLVGAGLVKRCESGTGNMERFGTTFRWREAIEKGQLEVGDYSHLAMVSRFLAGEMGIPFIPIKSLLGTDILAKKPQADRAYHIMENPWNPGEPVVLLPALNPDVAIIHAQRADEMGNCIIEGFAAHDVELARASKAVIVSCEEVISSQEIRRYPEATTIPYIYVSAVVEQPWGAYPTSVYRYYDYDEEHLNLYQRCAREGGKAYQEYLEKYILSCGSFDEYLEKAAGVRRLLELRQSMLRML